MERTRQLAALIETEQWMQAQVPIEFIDMVVRIIDSATAVQNSTPAIKSQVNKSRIESQRNSLSLSMARDESVATNGSKQSRLAAKVLLDDFASRTSLEIQ